MSAPEGDYAEQLSQERGYDEDEMNKIVGDVMNFIILKHSRRHPVKMTEISKDVIKSKARQSRLNNEMVMNIVAQRFKEMFGYKLKEVVPWV